MRDLWGGATRRSKTVQPFTSSVPGRPINVFTVTFRIKEARNKSAGIQEQMIFFKV